MRLEEPMTLGQLFHLIRNKDDRSIDYCIYGKEEDDGDSLDSVCYAANPPEITDEDEEIYPDFVLNNELSFWFSDELVQTVVDNALYQSSAVSDETILMALKYYSEKDCYMTITE